MTFRVGQKVVCVKPEDDLQVNRIYTIVGVGMFRNNPMVDVDGSEFSDLSFFAWRFRPIVSRKTSIAIFTEMLTKTGADA